METLISEQPEIIPICAALRLKKYDGNYSPALSWYQDETALLMINGNPSPYGLPEIQTMYSYQSKISELYFIEQQIDGTFTPVGDVSFSPEDITIMIAPDKQHQGIGTAVIQALIRRARSLHYPVLHVQEIYDFNTASQKLFTRLGFVRKKKTALGHGYLLRLDL